MNKASAIELRVKLGFERFHLVPSDGRASGLVLFYNLINEVVLNYSSENFIDGIVMDGNAPSWRLTGFYGEPCWERKHLSWSYLRHIHATNTGPWMIIGDFNFIRYLDNRDLPGGTLMIFSFLMRLLDIWDF